jgi:hypothetical protein
MGTFPSYAGLGFGIGLSWLVVGALMYYLLIWPNKQSRSADETRSPVKNPLPIDFQHELLAHGICPWTVREVQRLDKVTHPQIKRLVTMVKEGRTRGTEILEVVSHGKKPLGHDEAIYLVSVVDPREIENVVIAFLGRKVNSTCYFE